MRRGGYGGGGVPGLDALGAPAPPPPSAEGTRNWTVLRDALEGAVVTAVEDDFTHGWAVVKTARGVAVAVTIVDPVSSQLPMQPPVAPLRALVDHRITKVLARERSGVTMIGRRGFGEAAQEALSRRVGEPAAALIADFVPPAAPTHVHLEALLPRAVASPTAMVVLPTLSCPAPLRNTGAVFFPDTGRWAPLDAVSLFLPPPVTHDTCALAEAQAESAPRRWCVIS